jgi:hypothetical protein
VSHDSLSRQISEAPGQESFLDVVANLVGILIILIMVIGSRATHAMIDAASIAAPAAVTDADVASARNAARAVEQDIHRVDGQIKRQQLEVKYRRSERDKFLQIVTLVQARLKQQRDQLDETERKRLEASRELLIARSELDDLKLSRQALDREAPVQNVIEHLPTPMAKTVFGEEVHFRLRHGRLAYVPWDELVTELKQDAPRRVWKLKDAPQITETLGPVRGFRMKYTLQRTQHVAQAGAGVAVQQGAELERFVLIPVQDDLGEPLERALQEGSEFRNILGQFDPDRTTVTVWVYPDSFNDFRTVKADLFRRGFLTAGRPMPEGHPIGGSPEGSRSASQ